MMEARLQEVDLSKPAPIEEPQRQYYFIAKARTYVNDMAKKLGRPLTACTKTFGCQMHLEHYLNSAHA